MAESKMKKKGKKDAEDEDKSEIMEKKRKEDKNDKEDPEKTADKEDQEKKIVKTFARRYCPDNPILAVRHRAIQAVYESEVAPKVAKQSSVQAGKF